jgi:hypothetical protein
MRQRLERIMTAQLAGPTADERTRGLRGFFPEGCTLDRVEVRGGEARICLTMAEDFVFASRDDLLLEQLVHLTVDWRESVPGLQSLSLQGRLPGGTEYFPIQEFLEPLPPPSQKPEDASGESASEPFIRLLQQPPRATTSCPPRSSTTPGSTSSSSATQPATRCSATTRRSRSRSTS